MFGWLFGNNEVKRLKDDTKQAFEGVKKDIASVSGWIKHLDSEKDLQKHDIEEIKANLSSINKEIEEVKMMFSVMNQLKPMRPVQTTPQPFQEQTVVYSIPTDAQTSVQTPNLDNFSVTERAILWVLINSDLKLSYEDIASVLGKEKSTIRGQINAIKSKSESLVSEHIEKNGKKRVYISDEMREKLLKKQKVRVREKK